MGLIRIPELRRRFGRVLDPSGRLEKRARAEVGQRILLKESREALRQPRKFDVFLSHSYADAEQILYIKRLLENHGNTVYVDWIEDQQMSRGDVDARTARVLRLRILACTSLLVANSTNADTSRWIPWELGYADGVGKRVGTIPFLETDKIQTAYKGAEYLGIYPYVTEEESKRGNLLLWATRSKRTYVKFDAWLKGSDPYYHDP
jgi:hypothetical protein